MPTPTTPAPATAAPGQDAAKRSRGPAMQKRRQQKSRYGTQMAEKQQLKEIYGVQEQQLRNYYDAARRSREETGPHLITLLERRLDNAVYRAGFAPTRKAARQMSTHRLLNVNGHPVDVPSYRLKAGDVVDVRVGKRSKSLFSNFEKRMQNVKSPSWILLNPAEFGFKVSALPSLAEANVGVDVQAIVEYFAR